MLPTSCRRSARRISRAVAFGVFGLATASLLGTLPAGAAGPNMKKLIQKMQSLNQTRGYLDAHAGLKAPQPLLGGPIKITITQKSGGVLVGLPDFRRLDPTVFGPPNMPRHYAGTPVITGVPPMLRVKAKGGGYVLKVRSPFGHKHIALPDGRLTISAIDATATDAATTRDKVRFKASWKDAKGNTYEVRCCKKLAAHGLEFPTFGGVVTNIIMHGFTGIGTPLMPSEYTYFAFWGFGQVMKNGKTLDKPRLIHGMLTEYVREKGYALGWDRDITPTRRQFHLMIAPFKPNMKRKVFVKSPVKTGFFLPNGKQLPFWHVMFENLKIESRRG